jgi:integrase
MKYVNRIHRPDGSVQLYLRKPGLPAVRLPDGLAEAALQRHVDRLIADLSEGPGVGRRTFMGALRAYELESPDFHGLAASTKYEYRRLLGEFAEDLGELAVSAFTPAYVNRLKVAWAKRGHRAANLRLQVLKNVLKASLVAGHLKQDPFPLVGQVRRPRHLAEPHLVWSDAVLETAMAAGLAAQRHGLVRALAIARWTGARRGDLVRIPRSARENGRFRFVSGKRRVRVDIPEDPALTRWLDETPAGPLLAARRGRKLKAGDPPPSPATLVFNLAGQPYTEDGLGQELAKLVRALAAQGLIDSDRYDLHGLRHTRGVELALAGCSDAEGAALMGHSSASSFAAYRRQADRTRLSDVGAARLATAREGAWKRTATEKCNKVQQS